MNNNNNAFKINAFQDFKTHLIICENIFENPSQIREHALQQYTYSTRKAYAYICDKGFISIDMLSLFSSLLKMDITIKAYHYLFIPNGFTKYPHRDNDVVSNKYDISMASVIYLNPELNETNYTAFYETFIGDITNNVNGNPSQVTSFVGNRYNKSVLYDGSVVHAPGNGFGNNINKPQDIRLNATYFIDACHLVNNIRQTK